MGLRVRILLDTHSLIWTIQDESSLSRSARRLLGMHSTVLLVGVASLWEISIKISRGKLKLDCPMAELIDKELPENEIEILPIEREHLLLLQNLPFPTNGHADPFDRMIVAQALAEDLELLSADAKLDAYGVKRVW